MIFKLINPKALVRKTENNLQFMFNFCHNPPLMDHHGGGLHLMNLGDINGGIVNFYAVLKF